jgi:hypothetical protein
MYDIIPLKKENPINFKNSFSKLKTAAKKHKNTSFLPFPPIKDRK